MQKGDKGQLQYDRSHSEADGDVRETGVSGRRGGQCYAGGPPGHDAKGA